MDKKYDMFNKFKKKLLMVANFRGLRGIDHSRTWCYRKVINDVV